MWYALFDYIICVCSVTIKIFVLFEHTFPVQSRRCTLNGVMFKQMLHTLYLSKKFDWFYPIISASFFSSAHSIFYVIIIHIAIKAFFRRRRAHYMILIIEKSEHVFFHHPILQRSFHRYFKRLPLGARTTAFLICGMNFSCGSCSYENVYWKCWYNEKLIFKISIML